MRNRALQWFITNCVISLRLSLKKKSNRIFFRQKRIQNVSADYYIGKNEIALEIVLLSKTLTFLIPILVPHV
jgi:hypothetical protein